MKIKDRLNGQTFNVIITILLTVMVGLFGVTSWLLTEAYANVDRNMARIELKVDKNLTAINLGSQQVMQHFGEHSAIDLRLNILEDN